MWNAGARVLSQAGPERLGPCSLEPHPSVLSPARGEWDAVVGHLTSSAPEEQAQGGPREGDGWEALWAAECLPGIGSSLPRVLFHEQAPAVLLPETRTGRLRHHSSKLFLQSEPTSGRVMWLI